MAMTPACSNHPFVADRLSEAEQRIAEQQAYIQRMIVHGALTQAAEDRLRQLEQNFEHLRAMHYRRNV